MEAPSARIHTLLLIALVVVLFAIGYHSKDLPTSSASKKSPLVLGKPAESKTLKNISIVGYDGPALLNESDPKIKIAESAPASTTPRQPAPPLITAESYLVGNLETGEVYFSKDPGHVFPIASISKLFTSIVLKKLIVPEATIMINESMLEPYGSEGNLAVNEEYTRDELMYPLILESSNDAAEAFSQAVGTSTFIKEMNNLAGKIGLPKTKFADPSGLSNGNVSSAQDLFTFAQYLYANEDELLQLSRTPTFDMATSTKHNSHHFVNSNVFTFDPHYYGGKTGRTDAAKETMLSMFKYDVNGKLYPIVVIVLRSDMGARQYDAELLYQKFITKVEHI